MSKHRTPVREDKRFWLTVGTMGAVLSMVSCGHEPSEQILTFLGLTLAAYLGQSQLGQTKRATTPMPPEEPEK